MNQPHKKVSEGTKDKEDLAWQREDQRKEASGKDEDGNQNCPLLVSARQERQ